MITHRNAEGVRKYWDDRVAQNGKYENIYTLGMRGIHDSADRRTKDAAGTNRSARADLRRSARPCWPGM